jgi:hypothetical protein
VDIYYDCKTCGQPYGFGRTTFEPAECNRCDPPPPNVPEPSDFELGEQAERERIIKLIEPQVTLHREQGLDASADYLTHLIAIINGENK